MSAIDTFVEQLVSRKISESEANAFFSSCSEPEKLHILSQLELRARPPAPTGSVTGERLSMRTNANCTETQRRFIESFMTRYEARTRESKRLAIRHQRTFADQRMPANFNPLLKAIHYPITFISARGATLTDVDGNEYIDIAGDFGVNLFGHQPAFLTDALKRQLDHGWALSGRYAIAGKAADLFCELTGHERVTFCQSGTESLMSALRIARSHTERPRVAIFDGAYHGHADIFLDSDSPGVSRHSTADALVLQYGDQSALDAIEEHAESLAAVIVEPVQSGHLSLQPVEFLKQLRALTAKHGIILVFDEMITSFRVHPRGCEGLFGIRADLATYGKILSGGMPGGAVAGRADLMRWVDGGEWAFGDDSRPASTTYIAGTHTQNPLKMAATLAILEQLKAQSPQLQDSLNRRTSALAERVNHFCEQHALPVEIIHFGSQFRFRFISKQLSLTQGLFLNLLNARGIRYQLHGNCFLTAAHTDSDVQQIESAITDVLRELLQHGFFYKSARESAGENSVAMPDATHATRATPRAQPRARTGTATAKQAAKVKSVPLEPVVSDLMQVIGGFLELAPDEFQPDDRLAHLGVDSIMLMGIAKALQKRYDIKVPAKNLAEATSIRSIARMLVEQYADAMARQFLGESAAVGADSDTDPGPEPVETAPAPRAIAQPPAVAPRASRAAALREPVAIIGMSGVFPGAADVKGFWRNLLARECSITEVPAARWDWRTHFSAEEASGKTQSKWGGFLAEHDRFDSLFFQISPREAKYLDPQVRLLLEQSYHAIEDAGLSPRSLAGTSTGVFIGYEFSDYHDRLQQLALADEGAALTGGNEPYHLANRISFALDLRGPSEALNLNCASSAAAINRAVQSLDSGESDVALAGGVSLNLFPESFIRAGSLLSADGSCSVFDRSANGFSKGEGCAVLVLKRLADAERDRDPIYAVIRNTDLRFRGHGRSLSDVREDALSQVITACHARAAVDAAEVRYIEVDGYSTTDGDLTEYRALKQALHGAGADHKFCGIGSLKANVGNLEPASGVAAVIKVALALKHRQLPATIGVRQLNEEIDIEADTHPLYVVDRNLPFEQLPGGASEPVLAGVNSFANTGVNVHILLEEHRDAQPPRRYEAPYVFVLSARSAAALTSYAQAWCQYLDEHPDTDLARATATQQFGREAFKHRLAVVCNSVAELRRRLMSFAEGAKQEQVVHGVVSTDEPTQSSADAQSLRAMHTRDLGALARLWVQGSSVAWTELYAGSSPQALHGLPAYPFQRKRYWHEGLRQDEASMAQGTPLDRIATETVEKQDTVEVREAVSASPSIAKASGTPELELRAEILATIQKIRNTLLELDDETEIDDSSTFAEMGFTSITIVEFIDRLNQHFALQLHETTAFDYPNASSLATHLETVLSESQQSAAA